MRSFTILSSVIVGSMALAAAPVSCGSNTPGGFDNPDGANGDENNGDENVDPFGHDGSGGDAQDSLIITPMDITLTASGTPVTQPYVATLASTNMPTTAVWAIGNPAMGGIDGTGLFTSNGTVGGVTDIQANVGAAMGTTTVTVNVSLTENPGGVSGAVQTQLKAGGNADGAFKWLYPYDQTVFPRGLTPPTLQGGGTDADATYVHITSLHFTYDGFYGATNTSTCPQGVCIDFSTTTWKNIVESAGANDPVKVQVTKIKGGAVTGPITETWNIAQANLHGTVYYDTYTSQLASGGATLAIKVGKPAVVLVGSCNTCHSVSANGNVLAASFGHTYDATYDLTKAGAPKLAQGADHTMSFPAIYPDGTMMLQSYGDMIPGMWESDPIALLDTKTGNDLGAKGISGLLAAMPAFSVDGKMVVFNDEAASQKGHTLRTMLFDVKTKTFSGGTTNLVTDSTYYPSWPQFTPDAARVIFGMNVGSDYSTWSNEHANLAQVDVTTKKVTMLDTLNGVKGSGTYLPYGSTEEQLNYEPTVLPLAVGGYYWVVFTSRRFYGNIMNPTNYPDPWSSTPRKKLWVAAIDINPKPGVDPSHPAFYLPGQEFVAGNMRGFWALDPCKTNGVTCETSDECCGGYCRQVSLSDGGLGRQCVPPPGGCSNEFETCTTASDCCNLSLICVGGRCASSPPN